MEENKTLARKGSIMQKRTEITKGRRKLVIIREASGVDRVKEAIEYIMPGIEFPKDKEEENKHQGINADNI